MACASSSKPSKRPEERERERAPAGVDSLNFNHGEPEGISERGGIRHSDMAFGDTVVGSLPHVKLNPPNGFTIFCDIYQHPPSTFDEGRVLKLCFNMGKPRFTREDAATPHLLYLTL